MQQSAQKEGGGEEGHPQYLEPSELGTKEYWETFYTRSLGHIASKKRAWPDPRLDAEEPSASSWDDDESGGEEGEEEADDDDDPGTSWFSEHDAPLKVLRFLTSRKFPLSPRRQARQQQPPPSILDLGTGNGSMLAMLRKRGGFMGQMVGVDYSAQSVQLARELQRLKLHSAYESDEEESEEESEGEQEEEKEEEEHEDVVAASNTGSTEAIPVNEQDIRFEEWDILDPNNEDALGLPPPADGDDDEEKEKRRIAWFPYHQAGFDIVLDKGTFDAVSLSDETIATTDNPTAAAEKTTVAGKTVQPRICDKYPRVAAKLVRPGGFLVVTSCNWTEEELVRWFTAAGELLVWGRVEYPRFRFGGHEGQGVCTVCFRRGVS